MSLTKEEVQVKLRDSNVVVLDVLPDTDYDKLHIKGSDNLPLGLNMDHFIDEVARLYGKEKFFITYCAGVTCNAGPDAAKALKAKGFQAEDYAGGMQEWSEAGFPTDGSEAMVPAVAGLVTGSK
jgi:rhodanese-related sulfurtransferase